jgi:excisionase family DNA binding protein
MTELPDLMTIEEAAIALRVSGKTIRRMLADGRLRGVNLGRTWRIPRETVLELLGGRINETTVYVVSACITIQGQPVDMFCGVHATLEGARAALEKDAKQRGQVFMWEGHGRLGFWRARIGADRYSVAPTTLHD